MPEEFDELVSLDGHGYASLYIINSNSFPSVSLGAIGW